MRLMIGSWDNRREYKAEDGEGKEDLETDVGCRRGGCAASFYKGNVCPPFAAVGRERGVRAAGRVELLGKGRDNGSFD